jgi:hypothetical protein
MLSESIHKNCGLNGQKPRGSFQPVAEIGVGITHVLSYFQITPGLLHSGYTR